MGEWTHLQYFTVYICYYLLIILKNREESKEIGMNYYMSSKYVTKPYEYLLINPLVH
jgi:hypothetical protein